MAVAFFHIPLSVKPAGGGDAELIPPGVLQGLNYRFVIIKEGGEEGIVKLEEPQQVLQKVAEQGDCKKLTAKQLKDLKQSYTRPKIKQKYRTREQVQEDDETTAEPFELDDKGNRIIDTFQTVRSGFYLIDVPVDLN